MHYQSVSSIKSIDDFDYLIAVVFGNVPGPSISKISKPLADEISDHLKLSQLRLKTSGYDVFRFCLRDNYPDIVLVQFDCKEKVTVKTIKKQLLDVFKHTNIAQKKSVLLCWSELRDSQIDMQQYYQLLTQYCETNSVDFLTRKNSSHTLCTIEKISFFEPGIKQKKSVDRFIEYGTAIAQGINISNSLSNLPANLCTPKIIAKRAIQLTNNTPVKTTVLDENQMQALQMNCIAAVSKGSSEPARTIVMSYQGARADSPPIALIGKGVTFDSGGYSIKSAAGMVDMKFDMCGAATVIGTMHAASILNIPVNLTAVIPCSENLINGRAFKPGDILTSMSGKTIEILSTDAEGRLLLADALTYCQRFKPALVIDVATLTGASITALGYDISALMSNNKKLTDRLCKAGQMAHDYVWPLPTWQEYSEALNSNFADMASSAGRNTQSGAGAIVAACFLSKFIHGFRWAHIDVAGTAWHRGKQLTATGRPVPLLCQFLINYSRNPF